MWWQREGRRRLDAEDPWLAWQLFQRAAAVAPPGPPDVGQLLGLGESHLMLGRAAFARRYAERVVAREDDNQDGMALCVRALIRARAFDLAVTRSRRYVDSVPLPAPELLAARGSALFRVQRIDESAAVYRRVCALAPRHPEANLRLGSGLTAPVEIDVSSNLRSAVIASRAGKHDRAIELLLEVLQDEPGNPIAHRLLGEALYNDRATMAMASTDAAFAALRDAMPVPYVRGLPVAAFVVGYDELSPSRRRVVDRTAALFARHLGKLVAIGSRHQLLLELERTTDAKSRQSLRGQRTFDGRVWDDVRGIGGLQAATGIESLDEAAQFGFDTIAHEVAHQVHFYAFTPLQRAKIKRLYKTALRENRCLDFYAASNEAEYFGQGVEAFVSLGKRPGCETTHGHTRFELFAIDPALHDFIAGLVDDDPLRDFRRREAILAAATAVALRCGRPSDAMVAVGWMEPSPERDRLARAAETALAAATTR